MGTGSKGREFHSASRLAILKSGHAPSIQASVDNVDSLNSNKQNSDATRLDSPSRMLLHTASASKYSGLRPRTLQPRRVPSTCGLPASTDPELVA